MLKPKKCSAIGAAWALAWGLSALCTLSARADYQSTVLSYSPAAYWRLNETISPPPGDVATNAGTLGALGAGLYLSGANHPTTGALIASADTAAYFPDQAGNRVRVPYHPTLAAAAPFSVEFWANPAALASGDSATMCPVAFTQFGNPPGTGDARRGWLFYQNGNSGWTFRVYGDNNANQSAIGSQAVTAGTWYHVVGVYDGSAATLYVNGQKLASVAASSFAPVTNAVIPLSIGARADGQLGFFRYYGSVDEVAFYTNVLSAAEVLAHYQNGISLSPATSYAQVVQAKQPPLYLRLNEPYYIVPDSSGLPVAQNLGTQGASDDGVFQPATEPGVSGVPYSGFGAPNRAVRFNGFAGYIDAGGMSDLDIPGNVSVAAWLKSDGPAYAFQTLMGKGDGAYRLAVDTSGLARFANGSAPDAVGSHRVDDGAWHLVVGVYDSSVPTNYVYVDGILDGFSAGATALSANSYNVMIGTAPDYLGSRIYSGSIDEVAIFTNALSLAQIRQLYNAAETPPQIVLQPQAPSGAVYEGFTVTLSALAVGTPTLGYQWMRSGTPLPGQTATTLTLKNVLTTDSGNYALVVTNAYGTVTSAVVALTVQAGPPLILQQPASLVRYAGAAVTFAAVAGGSAPLAYQWKFNNTPLAGATASSYTISSAQLAQAGAYTCTITNTYGTTNTVAASLTVAPAPAGAYPQTVLADHPIGYWRLGETNGTVAFDYYGGKDGQYTNVVLGVGGNSVLDADTAVQVGPAMNSYVAVPSIDFVSGGTFSLEAWVKGAPNQVGDVGILSKGTGSGGEQFNLDTGNGGAYRFFVRNASGTVATISCSTRPDGTWQHLVVVFDPTGGQMTLYINGQPQAQTTPPSGALLASSRPFSIGARQSGSGDYDFNFTGVIDEVAAYGYALSPAQVSAHYEARYNNAGPAVRPLPAAVTNYATLATTLTAEAGGAEPLQYQWKFNGADLAGANASSLTLGPLDITNTGDYSVTISNPLGTTNSTVTRLKVLPAPAAVDVSAGLVLHLKFDNDLLDYSGRGNNATNRNGATFVAGKIGSGALHYSTDTGLGVYKYVTLGLRPDLQFSSNVNFTVAYWIRLPAGAFPGDLPFICNAAGSTYSPGYTFAPSYQRGGWACSLNNQGVYGANSSINDGAWHHLVHTFDRNGFTLTYLDGLQVDTEPWANHIGTIDTGLPTNIGQDPNGNYAETGEADIDDVGIWRRVLSPMEVGSIYAAGNVHSASFVSAPVRLSVQAFTGQVQLLWSGGLLQAADQVTGPYSDVSGATSPWPVAPGSGKKFYRVRQ